MPYFLHVLFPVTLMFINLIVTFINIITNLNYLNSIGFHFPLTGNTKTGSWFTSYFKDYRSPGSTSQILFWKMSSLTTFPT